MWTRPEAKETQRNSFMERLQLPQIIKRKKFYRGIFSIIGLKKKLVGRT